MTVAKGILMDWQRGVIPFFNFPPDYVHKDVETEEDRIQKENEIKDLHKQLNEKEIIPLEDMDKEDIEALSDAASDDDQKMEADDSD